MKKLLVIASCFLFIGITHKVHAMDAARDVMRREIATQGEAVMRAEALEEAELAQQPRLWRAFRIGLSFNRTHIPPLGMVAYYKLVKRNIGDGNIMEALAATTGVVAFCVMTYLMLKMFASVLPASNAPDEGVCLNREL